MEIKIEHLNKNYGKQSALKDISLEDNKILTQTLCQTSLR